MKDLLHLARIQGAGGESPFQHQETHVFASSFLKKRLHFTTQGLHTAGSDNNQREHDWAPRRAYHPPTHPPRRQHQASRLRAQRPKSPRVPATRSCLALQTTVARATRSLPLWDRPLLTFPVWLILLGRAPVPTTMNAWWSPRCKAACFYERPCWTLWPGITCLARMYPIHFAINTIGCEAPPSTFPRR